MVCTAVILWVFFEAVSAACYSYPRRTVGGPVCCWLQYVVIMDWKVYEKVWMYECRSGVCRGVIDIVIKV